MRFLVRLVLGLLLVASLGLGGLYAATPYPPLAARLAEPNFGLDSPPVFPVTPARYAALRAGLAAVAGLAGAGLLGDWARRRRWRRPVRRPAVPVRWVAPLQACWQALSCGERLVAGGLLLVGAAVRVWYAVGYPLNLDEIASYDYSVLPGPALTACYYPFPNNHLLPNLLVGLVHQLLPAAGALVALRLLPTLLGLAVLGLGYALLLRYLRFGAATLGWGLFSLSPLPAFYAVAGRGYGWGLAALLAGLWASLALLRPQGPGRAGRQRAWAVFASSAVLGLYAVPTHLYALLGLGLGLLAGFGRWRGRRRALSLLHLAVATGGIGLVAAVLYAPVVAVSGWPALVANPYVLRIAAPEFWANVGPYYLLGTASELLGRREASAALFALVALLVPVALRWGRLPEPARRFGWLAYAQLGLWLPLLLAQRVYPPARTLLAVLLCLFGLIGVLGQAAWQRWRPLGVGQPTPVAGLLALGLALAGYGGYRLGREQAVVAVQQHSRQVLGRAYSWLRAQHPRQVRVGESERAFAIIWHHYALNAGQPPLPLVLREAPRSTPLGAAAGPATGPVYDLYPTALPGRPAAYAEAPVVVVLSASAK